MTTRFLLRLPDDLAQRFRRAVAPRERSRFIGHLLDHALPAHTTAGSDVSLYRAALAVDEDEQLAAEMADWEVATSADGIADLPSPPKS
jgi:hypothetical protein